MYAKTKEIDPVWGARAGGAPLDSPMLVLTNKVSSTHKLRRVCKGMKRVNKIVYLIVNSRRGNMHAMSFQSKFIIICALLSLVHNDLWLPLQGILFYAYVVILGFPSRYVGCFYDATNKMGAYFPLQAPHRTVEGCLQLCYFSGQRYAGKIYIKSKEFLKR